MGVLNLWVCRSLSILCKSHGSWGFPWCWNSWLSRHPAKFIFNYPISPYQQTSKKVIHFPVENWGWNVLVHCLGIPSQQAEWLELKIQFFFLLECILLTWIFPIQQIILLSNRTCIMQYCFSLQLISNIWTTNYFISQIKRARFFQTLLLILAWPYGVNRGETILPLNLCFSCFSLDRWISELWYRVGLYVTFSRWVLYAGM